MTDNLGRLQQNLKTLGQGQKVSFADLFPPAFMVAHTKFPDMQTFIEASGLLDGPLTPNSFQAMPDEPWDKWVSNQTTFTDWAQMQTVAARKWVEGKLFEGLH